MKRLAPTIGLAGLLATTLLSPPNAAQQHIIGTASFPGTGLRTTLEASEQERYQRFTQENPQHSRTEATMHLTVRPDACTPSNDCAYSPVTAREVRAAFATHIHIRAKPGITWSVTNRQHIPDYVFTPLTERDFITERTAHNNKPVRVLATESFTQQITPSYRTRHSHNTPTAHTYARPDTVVVQLPGTTDTVRIQTPLPEDVLLLQHQGQRYTFPGARIVCYEGEPRRCVPIPGRE